MRARAWAALLALALGAGGCTSLEQVVSAERAADDAALAAEALPDAPWVVVAGGAVSPAAGPDEAAAAAPGARHRYAFRPGEAGDRHVRLAYLPESGLVAGQGFAEALGLRLRRDARSGLVLARDTRRATTGADATVRVRLAAPDGAGVVEVAVVIDPDFDGALLVPASIARSLGLARHEIPGIAGVQVALGAPFRGHRARVRAEVPELGAAGVVEAVHP